jgi:hypothetical protein
LDTDGAGDRVNDALEFDKNTVSSRFYDATAVTSDRWVGQLSADGLQCP